MKDPDKSESREKQPTRVESATALKTAALKPKKVWWTTRTIANEIDRELFLKLTIIYFLIYLVFLTCCILNVMILREHSLYHMYSAMTSHFINQEFIVKNNRSIVFEQIKSAEDFWSYLDYFIDILYKENIYDERNGPIREAEGEERKLLMQNHVLGVARLRQLQVTNDSCYVHPLMRNIFRTCFSNYEDSKKNKKSFGNGKGTAWTYHTEAETESISFSGFTGTYGGDGYYQELTTERNGSRKVILDLKRQFWLQRETRVIFVDFSIYNANINTFCVCKLVFEFPHIGGVIAYHRFIPIISSNNKFLTLSFVCKIIIIVLLVYYICEFLREAVYFKFRYLRHFWAYWDLGIIVTTITALLVWWFHRYEGVYKLRQVKTKPDVYGNLELPAYWFTQYKNFIALQLFFAYIKVFKFLNFNKTMGQLNDTIKKAKGDVFGFSIMFFIIFFAFAELGYLLFGEKAESFKDFPTSMFTLLRTILGDFDYDVIRKANRVMAPIYFVCFIFFIFFVLLNMFLAIIDDSYSDVKTEIAIAPDEMQMTEYLKMKLNAMCGMCKKNEGSQSKSKPKLTVEEIDEILKKCGFTDAEIEAFLLRYLTVDRQGQTPEVSFDKLENEVRQQEELLDKSFETIKPKDYFLHQEKLDQIDNLVDQCTDRLDKLLDKLESSDKVLKIQRK